MDFRGFEIWKRSADFRLRGAEGCNALCEKLGRNLGEIEESHGFSLIFIDVHGFAWILIFFNGC